MLINQFILVLQLTSGAEKQNIIQIIERVLNHYGVKDRYKWFIMRNMVVNRKQSNGKQPSKTGIKVINLS